MLFLSPPKAQSKLADIVRERRLLMELTQEGLSNRSGVPLSTLRKFEQKGSISLESFLKLIWVVGGLGEMLEVLEPQKIKFNSIDEVLKNEENLIRKKGRKK